MTTKTDLDMRQERRRQGRLRSTLIVGILPWKVAERIRDNQEMYSQGKSKSGQRLREGTRGCKEEIASSQPCEVLEEAKSATDHLDRADHQHADKWQAALCKAETRE